MAKLMHYDKEGEKISIEQWSALFGDEDYKRIGDFTLGPYRASTVWIGIDASESSPPRIFETALFHEDDDPILGDEDIMSRYPTEEKARHGHEGYVRLIEEVLYPQWLFQKLSAGDAEPSDTKRSPL